MIKDISNQISDLKTHLKEKYIGIDNVIDEVVFHIENWIRFKDYQETPYVVNLWGMTGTGKSSLIEELVEYLKIQDVYFPFDMGYASNSRTSLFDFDINYSKDYGLIVFDEFQHLKSHRHNEDHETKNSRAIWNFLDTGKLDLYGSNYDLILKIKLLQTLVKNMIPLQFDIQYCRVHDKLDIYKNLVRAQKRKYPTNELYNDSGFGGIEITEEYGDIIPEQLIEEIFENILHKESDRQNFLDHINSNEISRIKEALDFTYRKGRATKKRDLSKSIVFVIGNLDDAYEMTIDVGLDNEADDLNALSKKVNIADIRRSLFKRYRPEQIGRLGNNHVIYPSFSKDDLKNVIKLKLKDISQKFKSKTDLEIEFDDSLVDLIYDDGAIPSQGVRPIISTVNSYIRGNLNLIMNETNESDDKVVWSFKDNSFHFIFSSSKEQKSRSVSKSILIRLKQSELKSKRDKNLDAVVSVHEAGHAVAYLKLFNRLPERIQIGNDGVGGWNTFHKNKAYSKINNENDIVVRHAGRVAEEKIFGEDNLTNGGRVDISELTCLAIDYYASYGFGDNDQKYKNQNDFMKFRSNFFTNDEIFDKAEELIKSQKKVAYEIIDENLDLLIIIADELTKKRSLSKIDLLTLLRKNNFDHDQFSTGFSYSDKFEEFKNELMTKKDAA